MKVSDVMTRKVICIAPDATFRELWGLIFKTRVNALPVVNKQKILMGLITREDVLRFLYPDYREYVEDLMNVANFEEMEEKIHELLPLRVRDFMSTRVIFTREDTPVMRALSRMIARRVNQLPVLTEGNRVAGMITKGDIFYALFRQHLQSKHHHK